MASGLLAMAAGLTAGLPAHGASSPVAAELPGPPKAERPVPGAAERARWLVTFTAPPVAARFAGVADTGTEGSREDRMRAYAETLRQARLPSLKAMRLQGWVVLSTSEYSANAVVVEGLALRTPAELEALRQLPGVGSVQPVGLYRADPGASAPQPAPLPAPLPEPPPPAPHPPAR